MTVTPDGSLADDPRTVAGLRRELDALAAELAEARAQQAAITEVLGVTNASPGNLTPVFDAILEKAHSVCAVSHGSLDLVDGDNGRAVAVRGLSDAYANQLRQGYRVSDSLAGRRLLAGEPFVQFADAANADFPLTRRAAELEGIRTVLIVPLRKDTVLLGAIISSRREVRPFSEREVSLLQNFAAQAVIAMENARLLTETREALEQQTATAEVLQVINASPGNLAPVFDAMLAKAHSLCGAEHGSLYATDGEAFRAVAVRGMPEAFADLIRQPFRPGPNHPVRQLIAGAPFAVVRDASEVDDPIIQESFKLAGMRSALFVPLKKDKLLLGYIVAGSPRDGL
jgi:GAF domain-containing protein